jgi:hypothetical protein
MVPGAEKNPGGHAARLIVLVRNGPSIATALACSTRCAPRGGQRIRRSLFMHALTRPLTSMPLDNDSGY